MPILATKGAGSVQGFGFGGGCLPCLIVATGGTVTECGDFRTHIFTGPGTFTVSKVKASSPGTADYLVVAGGGGTGKCYSGGGGAGGFRLSNELALPAPTTSPLANPTGITLTAQGYPITVGGGGSGGCSFAAMSNGADSIFSTITSSGGGKSSFRDSPGVGNPGGSGGGNSNNPGAAGSGNTPPTSPPQGNPGGSSGNNTNNQGGGGGAGAAGQNTSDTGPAVSPTSGTQGGIGSFIADSFIGPTSPSYGESGPVGSTRYFAGGGGGGSDGPQANSVGGIGGGGNANIPPNSPTCSERTDGTVNTGGGAGGGQFFVGGKSGGSGIVVIRYKFQ
jgi:hypothetical protein